MELVGHPEVIEEDWFASGRQRAAHADLLDEMVGDWIAARTREEVIDEFEQAGAAIGPVYDAADIVADPHVRATEMITRVPDDDLGDMAQHNVMWRMTETPGSIRFTGRALGADTDAVLVDELGLDPAHVDALRTDGIIA